MPNNSTSFALEDQPKLILSIAVSSNPIAASTCEGRTFPDEQAEPDEIATPSRSSAITAVWGSRPGDRKALVLARRSTPRPKNRAWGRISATCRSTASRSSVIRRPSPSIFSIEAEKAAAKPAAAATFSVPARRPASCPPPRKTASLIWISSRTNARARRRPVRRACARKRTKYPRPMSRMLHCSARRPGLRRRQDRPPHGSVPPPPEPAG